MGFIEKISPKLAYQRECWLQAYNEVKRGYDAGKFDRLNSRWFAVNEGAEQTDKNYRDILRARSRDLERNSDIMGALVSPWERNIRF